MVSSEVGTQKTEEGPKRRYQRYMYTFWGGGFKGHFSKQNVLFCGLELVQGGREGEGEGEGAGGRGLKPQSSSLKLSGSVVPGGGCLAF